MKNMEIFLCYTFVMILISLIGVLYIGIKELNKKLNMKFYESIKVSCNTNTVMQTLKL